MMRFLFFVLGLSILVSSDKNPQVKIDDGKIDGTILKSKEGNEFFAFRGIPFAEPPLGSLRFKPPVPKESWKTVLDATKPHAICPQKDIFAKGKLPEGEENCLFLNVYTPRLPSENSQLLPVMVFFHGGGFISGSGDYSHYGPELLLDQDIVLVIGNYRLGALGFLSTEDEVAPGNYGLKDQSLILRWVNQNIEHFGGDPRSVTIFGESAGGSSVNLHMFSPLSRGLFKGVISQSGTAFSSWALAPKGENLKNAKLLAKNVNCPTLSSKELLECLRNVDHSVLVEEVAKFMGEHTEPRIQFRPVVESSSAEAFLTDTPHELLEAKKFADVPFIVGITKNEGLVRSVDYLHNPTSIDHLNDDFNNEVANSLNYRAKVTDINAVGQKIKKFYFGDGRIDAKQSFSALTDMYTDGWLTENLDETIRSYRKVSKNPVYSYVFDHDGPLSITSVVSSSNEFYGSCHADDLIYQFPNVEGFFPKREEFKTDKKFIEFFTTLWANFARTGNPTPDVNNVIKRKWEPVESDKLEHFYISPKVHEMRDALFEDRVKFWRSLPFKTRNNQKDEL